MSMLSDDLSYEDRFFGENCIENEMTSFLEIPNYKNKNRQIKKHIYLFGTPQDIAHKIALEVHEYTGRLFFLNHKDYELLQNDLLETDILGDGSVLFPEVENLNQDEMQKLINLSLIKPTDSTPLIICASKNNNFSLPDYYKKFFTCTRLPESMGSKNQSFSLVSQYVRSTFGIKANSIEAH